MFKAFEGLDNIICSYANFLPSPLSHSTWLLWEKAKLVDKKRQLVFRQRKARKKKDQEDRRQVEVLKEQRQQEEKRFRRERLRKGMRADLTMHDILGQKSVRNHPKSFP